MLPIKNRLLSATASLFMVSANAALADVVRRPPDATADVVYGQSDFNTGAPNSGGRSSNSLWAPAGVATDGQGNLYVADQANHRVLFYPAGNTTATRVYGQGGSFTTGDCNKGGISRDSLCQLHGVAIDPDGYLYVADFGNQRVLRYPPPSPTDPLRSPPADLVYGQDGFRTNGCPGISRNSTCAPYGVATDRGGNLYVVDLNYSRVLFYPKGLTTATRVYGQLSNFEATHTCNLLWKFPGVGLVSEDSLCAPTGVVTDSGGNLYITDSGNHRILFYPAESTTATRVYGQFGNFNTNHANNGGISANSLNRPRYVALDSDDNLYAGDEKNCRVLFYPEPSTTATQVYGQRGDFNAGEDANGFCNVGVVTAQSLSVPQGVATDSAGNLYIADLYNSRALKYTPPTPTAPSRLMATAVSSSQINLTWTDASSNETGFKIERAPVESAFEQIATVGADATSYASSGLTAGRAYRYRVRANNAQGDSGYSNVATATTHTTPAKPAGFRGTPNYTGTSGLVAIRLYWNNVANETSYRLEGCKAASLTATCTYALVKALPANSDGLIDTSVSVTGRGFYKYRVRADNAAGSSAWAETTVNAP